MALQRQVTNLQRHPSRRSVAETATSVVDVGRSVLRRRSPEPDVSQQGQVRSAGNGDRGRRGLGEAFEKEGRQETKVGVARDQPISLVKKT